MNAMEPQHNIESLGVEAQAQNRDKHEHGRGEEQR